MVVKKVKNIFLYALNAFRYGKKTLLAKRRNKIEIELNEEQINMLADGAVVGFLQFLENREKEFYKQLSKMRF